MSDAVLFYRSFMDAINILPEESQLDAYRAIIGYGLDEVMPEVSGAALAIFLMAKPQIDANIKRKSDGYRGGRPKKTNGFENEKPLVSELKTTGYETSKPKEKVKVKDKEKVKDKYSTLQNVMLTKEEYEKLVEEYGKDKTDKAVEYLGKYIIEKDYKTKSHYLTIRRWVMDAVAKKPQRANGFTNFTQRTDYNMAELEKILEQ